jgi:hypothetical protein
MARVIAFVLVVCVAFLALAQAADECEDTVPPKNFVTSPDTGSIQTKFDLKVMKYVADDKNFNTLAFKKSIQELTGLNCVRQIGVTSVKFDYFDDSHGSRIKFYIVTTQETQASQTKVIQDAIDDGSLATKLISHGMILDTTEPKLMTLYATPAQRFSASERKDCVLSAWGGCPSDACGGVHQIQRQILIQPTNGGDVCGPTTRTVRCPNNCSDSIETWEIVLIVLACCVVLLIALVCLKFCFCNNKHEPRPTVTLDPGQVAQVDDARHQQPLTAVQDADEDVVRVYV